MNQIARGGWAVLLFGALCLTLFTSGCNNKPAGATGPAAQGPSYSGGAMGGNAAPKTGPNYDAAYGPNRIQPKGYERAAPTGAGEAPEAAAYRQKMQGTATNSTGNAAPSR